MSTTPRTVRLSPLDQLRLDNAALRAQLAKRHYQMQRAKALGLIRLLLLEQGIQDEPHLWRLDPSGTHLVKEGG